MTFIKFFLNITLSIKSFKNSFISSLFFLAETSLNDAPIPLAYSIPKFVGTFLLIYKSVLVPTNPNIALFPILYSIYNRINPIIFYFFKRSCICYSINKNNNITTSIKH